ncbi:MAG: AAA family ATPase, partial [Gemmatimonadaceae bacterium]
ARLMQAAADGEIVCDAATMQSVRGRMEFEQGRSITVKGRVAPVQLYRPIGRRNRTTSAGGEMIGRAAERGFLAARLAALRESGEGSVVVIEGDAGLGKSRLLADATEQAAAAGVRVLRAAADAIERSTSYYAWRPVFLALFDLAPGMDADAMRARVASQMRGRAALERLAPLLSVVLPVRIADTELTAEMTGDVRAENTKRLLAALLRDAGSAAPLMLAIEDAHWLDSGSWALLNEIAYSVRELLVVVTTRPFVEPLPAELTRLLGAAERRLSLTGLSSEEMIALIARRLGVSSVPDALGSFIQERVSGHPFFAEELLQAMVDRGAVRVDGGACVVGDLTTLALPTTVEGVIISRLDRLAPGEQLCLKVASVIGRVFRSRLVQQTHPVDSERPRVPQHLSALSKTELIGIEAPDPELSYLFKHVITRDVTYDMMPQAQRRPLHRAVAVWYEENHTDLTPHFALLAYHWAQAGDSTKTVGYLEQAGQQAVRAGAFREATLFLSQAIELMDGGAVAADAVRRALWEKGIGTASYALGDFPGSRAHLERALADLHRPVPRSLPAAIRGGLGALAAQVAHRTLPRRYHARRAAEKAILDEAVECYKVLGQAYYMEGEAAPWLLYLTVSGLNLGEEAGDSAPLARVLSNAAMLAYLVGQSRQAEWYASRAIAMAESEGQYSAAAYVWSIRSLLFAQQAAWRDAREANAKALALSQEIGDASLEGEVWLVRSTVAHCAGDYLSAIDAWTEMRAVADRNGNAFLRCWSLLDEVETRLARGETDAAEHALAAALAIATPERDLGMTLEKQRAVAGTRLRQGRLEEALVAADAIFALVQKNPPTGYHVADHFAAAIEVNIAVMRAGGAFADARAAALSRRAAQGCAMLAKFAKTFVNVRPRSWLLRGMLAAEHGRVDEARRCLTRAGETATELEMPFERGRALLELARLDVEARDSILTEAREIFVAVGAPYYAR